MSNRMSIIASVLSVAIFTLSTIIVHFSSLLKIHETDVSQFYIACQSP